MERKEPKDKKHASNWGQPNKTKTINTTRVTRYVEGKAKYDPREEKFETKHDKATNRIQCGEENNSGFRKEPKNNTAKERNSHQDQKAQLKTSRDIMSMVRKGEMTHGQAEIKFDELGKEL